MSGESDGFRYRPATVTGALSNVPSSCTASPVRVHRSSPFRFREHVNEIVFVSADFVRRHRSNASASSRIATPKPSTISRRQRAGLAVESSACPSRVNDVTIHPPSTSDARQVHRAARAEHHDQRRRDDTSHEHDLDRPPQPVGQPVLRGATTASPARPKHSSRTSRAGEARRTARAPPRRQRSSSSRASPARRTHRFSAATFVITARHTSAPSIAVRRKQSSTTTTISITPPKKLYGREYSMNRHSSAIGDSSPSRSSSATAVSGGNCIGKSLASA